MTLVDLLSKAEQGADPEFLRDGLKLLAQELMDVEVTRLVGAGLHERSETRLTYATAIGSGSGIRGSAPSSWRSPNCGRGPTSRACWNLGAGTSGRCSQWSRRPTSMASAPALSMPWPRPWALKTPVRDDLA